MSALRLASRLLDEAALAGSRNVGVLGRASLWLSLPALVVGLCTLAIGPERILTGAAAVSMPFSDPAATAAVLGRAFALYAPLWLMVALCSIALEGATALAGWQLLHGRGASTRGLLLGLYARRWSVIGVVCVKALLIGAAQGVAVLPALGAAALALVVPGWEGLVLAADGVPLGAAVLLLLGLPMGLGWFVMSLAIPAVMVEDVGPIPAIRRSWRLLSYAWGASFWAWALSFGLGFVLVYNLQGLVSFTGLLEEGGGFGLTAALFAPRAYITGLITSLAASPVRALVGVALYRWLRVTHEGWDLEQALSLIPGQRS